MTTIYRRTRTLTLLFLLSCVCLLIHVEADAVSYTYDEHGRVKTITYENGVQITVEYDAAGNRTAITRSQIVDTIPPTQPPSVTFSAITATSATASWGASSDNVAVVGYDYRVNSGSWTSIGNVLSVSLSGLNQATNYTFEVRARDAANNTSPPRSGSFSTPDVSPPAQPGPLSFSNVTATTATVSWGASSDNVGVTAYEYRHNGGSWVNVGNVLSVDLTGLASSTTHTIEVRARDAAGNFGAARSGQFTTLDGTPPTQPSSLSFSNITVTTATASWGAASDNVGVTGYEYRLNSGSWVAVGNVLSVGLTGLSSYTNYTFEVRARDGANNAGPARSGSFRTADGTPPTQPGGLIISNITGTSAVASWSASSDNVGVTGYDYRLNSGAWVSLGNVLSVSLTGLADDTTHTFEVRARDAAGNLSAIASTSFTTPVHYIPITDAAGQVLPSASALYMSTLQCYQPPFVPPYCIWSLRKKYGDQAIVWGRTIQYQETCPYAHSSGSPGYREVPPSCVIEARASVYGK